MIHIISGMMRSGTSCMMAAMQAGGLDVVYSPNRNQMAAQHADAAYQPNPGNNLYEIPLAEYGGIGFPLQYQNKCIKVLLWGLDSLAVNPDGYRVVIMRRDPEEIRQSYEAFFGHPLRHPWMGEYDARIKRTEYSLRNRRDIKSVHVIDYAELINDAKGELLRLTYYHWPFTVPLAAATIDPAQYRFRKELLTAGI